MLDLRASGLGAGSSEICPISANLGAFWTVLCPEASSLGKGLGAEAIVPKGHEHFSPLVLTPGNLPWQRVGLKGRKIQKD